MNKRIISTLCAAVIMIAALSFSAFALTIEEQMAANSAAWHIANAAGDTATCEALHAANVALAQQAAGGSGNASFDAASGTWNISTSSGGTISSSSSQNGKTNTVTYSNTSSSGSVSSSSSRSYSDSSISAYKSAGGTNEGLQTSYNNVASQVSSSGNYGTDNAKNTAAAEAAVAKELLGLTNSQARQLQRDLEASKQQYAAAQDAYAAAVASGDTAAAEAAQAQMQAAHDAAQATRAQYNYTGDDDDATDGGYYYGNTSNPQSGGGFYTTNIVSTYKITASAGEGGKIDPTGAKNVKKDESQKYTITPNEGYEVKRVLVDGTDKGKLTEYTFNNVRAAHTIKAEFTRLKYTIDSSCGSNGSISPNGQVNVYHGDSKTYTMTPYTGYEVSKVIVDGVDKGKLTSYTFENVKEKHTISVQFAKKTFKITATAGEGGSISPNGDTTVNYGSYKTFTITPSTGYHIKSVVVDGVNKGERTSYTFSNVTAAHTISATFEKKTYNISASAGIGGTISPNGTSVVTHGSNKTYTITPSFGYGVADVKVDNVSVGAVTSYTFSNVTSAHTIKATFRVNGTVDAGIPTVTDTLGTDLSGDSTKSGYGVYVSVPVTESGVTGTKAVLSYNFGDGNKSITLVKSGSNYVLPVNSQSKTGARCVYIPVATADGTYTLTVTVTAKNVAGGTVSDTATATVQVLGSMYEDDFTGDS